MGVGASVAIVQFKLALCALAFSNEPGMVSHAGDGMTLPVFLGTCATQPGPWCMALAASVVQTGYAFAYVDCQQQDLVLFSCLGCRKCGHAVAMLLQSFDRRHALLGGIYSVPIFYMPIDLSASAVKAKADVS